MLKVFLGALAIIIIIISIIATLNTLITLTTAVIIIFAAITTLTTMLSFKAIAKLLATPNFLPTIDWNYHSQLIPLFNYNHYPNVLVINGVF